MTKERGCFVLTCQTRHSRHCHRRGESHGGSYPATLFPDEGTSPMPRLEGRSTASPPRPSFTCSVFVPLPLPPDQFRTPLCVTGFVYLNAAMPMDTRACHCRNNYGACVAARCGWAQLGMDTRRTLYSGVIHTTVLSTKITPP